MNGEIICVGTELLLGNIVNTNAQYISQVMAQLGFNVFTQTVVGDNHDRLTAELKAALKRSELIILTGGLGPTDDDITKEVAAKVLGLSLYSDKALLDGIKEYFKKSGRACPDGVEKQALVPEGAQILPNEVGTAAGFILSDGKKRIVLLPGPPNEMQTMLSKYAVPILSTLVESTIYSQSIKLCGLGESEAANRLGTLLDGENPTVATYAKPSEVMVRITAKATDEESAKKLTEKTALEIREIFGDLIYSECGEQLNEKTVSLLNERKLMVATAESCTAGLLSKMITDINGSSAVFEMGVSAYANEIKQRVLSVPSQVIAQYGAVSEQTAALMAQGVKQLANADIGIGITGVAGPEPSEGKPVGLVYIALADSETVWVRKLTHGTQNDREKIRINAAMTALDMIRRYAAAYPERLAGGTPIGEPFSLATSNVQFALPKAESFNENENAEPEPFVIDDEELEVSVSEFSDDKEKIDEPKPKPSRAKRILSVFFPMRGDRPLEVLRKIIFLIALIVFIVTGAYLARYYAQGSINEGMVDNARKTYNIANDGVDKNGMLLRFGELYKQNKDIKGWIHIDNTKIDYPVYQTDNNDYYIDHDMEKNESRYGAVFADCDCKITKDGNSKNIVLYGHNMIDGSMFSQLLNYKDLEFYKKNPLVSFSTLYGNDIYKVYAVMVTNAEKEDDDGYVFNYRQSAFSSDNNFLYWIKNISVRSIIDTGDEILPTDEILTLSTCSYEFDNARTVVVCRKLREGESAHIDTSAAKLNKNPLYPQAYYDKNGGKKPEVDLSYYTEGAEAAEKFTLKKFSAYDENGNELTTDALEQEVTKKTVTVGNYIGLSLNSAIYRIAQDGLSVESVSYDGLDENLNDVLEQSLKKGETVPEGTGIILSVSGMPREITVPKLVGKALSEAQSTATAAGLTTTLIKIASNKPENTVLLQSIKAKTVTTDRRIVLYVANGRNTVPDIVGQKTEKAKEMLAEAGFKYKVVKIGTVDKSLIGIVCNQSIGANEIAMVGDKITIYVGRKKTSSEKSDSSKAASSKANSSKTSSSAASSKQNSSKQNSSKAESSKPTASKSSSTVASSTVSSKPTQSTASDTVTSSATSDTAADSSASTSTEE